ncbi:hypothetical protein GCM10009589_20650 [Arthrobacter pascens]
MGILDAPSAQVGTPQSLPVAPIARDTDSSFGVNTAILAPTTVIKTIRARRARIHVVTAGGDVSVGAYDAALNRVVCSGAVGNGPGNFPAEIALPPTDLQQGLAYVAFSTSLSSSTFASHSTYGQQIGALMVGDSHPLPTALTGLGLQTKIPLVTLHPDDPTPLVGAYDRTDMGVYVIGKNPKTGRLYGYSATNGHWVTSDDAVTWTDKGRSPATDFGPDSTAISVVFNADLWWVTTLDGRLWKGTVDTFNSWINVTPPGMPAGSTGRYLNAAHNGSALFYSNYGLTGPYATPKNPSGAFVYKSTNNGMSWTTVLSLPAARHVHCVRVDPTDPNKIHVNVGDQGSWGGFGYYYSPDAGVTWHQAATGNPIPGRGSSNRYGIDICCTKSTPGTPSRIFMEGDGTAQPHVLQYYRANLGPGMHHAKIDPTIWFDDAPVDGGGSWKGSSRGMIGTSEGNLFFITTGEAGTIGTRYGIWMAKGPWYTTPVLLEETPAPWDFPVYNYGQTYEIGTYLINTRYRMTRPKFAGQ